MHQICRKKYGIAFSARVTARAPQQRRCSIMKAFTGAAIREPERLERVLFHQTSCAVFNCSMKKLRARETVQQAEKGQRREPTSWNSVTSEE